MADLRRLLQELGMADAQSLLQSGNLAFRSSGSDGVRLEGLLESEARKRLGLDTDFLVRTASHLNTVIAGNPFRTEAERDPAHLLVLFLKGAPREGGVGALQEAITGREVIRVRGREAYVVYPDGIGRSKLTNDVLERNLGTRVTGRNWNTILKLAAMAGR
jgi:uncharacterized protein (DUF1697 family)